MNEQDFDEKSSTRMKTRENTNGSDETTALRLLDIERELSDIGTRLNRLKRIVENLLEEDSPVN